MELKKVQYFLQIAEKGSLSKAAQSLYLTQPTLSRYLAKLEEDAGVPFFTRKPDSTLEMTEAGAVYLKTAQQINALWQDMEAELSSLKQQELIRLAIDNDSLHSYIQHCAKVIAQQFPHVQLQTQHMHAEQIHKAVLAGKIDLGLTSFFQLHDQLSYAHMQENEVDLVVSQSHPLAKFSYQLPGQATLRLQLGSLPADTAYLMMQEGHVLRQSVDRYMESQDIVPQVPTTYFRHDLLGKLLTENAQLAGFCPRNYRFGDLAYIALDPPFYHKRGFCYRKGHKLTPAQKLLLELLQQRPEQ